MAKLCNQLIVACNVLAIAESVALARKAGVDTTLLAQALHGGFADSKPLQIFGPRMAAHAFEPRLGAISLMEKDVVLSAQMADALGAVTPMLSAARELFARARTHGRSSPRETLSQAVLLFEQLADGPLASAPYSLHADQGTPMDTESERKVVVVTGGASGIGAACASYFSDKGWRVVVNYFLESEQEAAEHWPAKARASR
jgi:hypothetical protein